MKEINMILLLICMLFTGIVFFDVGSSVKEDKIQKKSNKRINQVITLHKQDSITSEDKMYLLEYMFKSKISEIKYREILYYINELKL